ncbi:MULTISPECIES: hypothetical protein [Streptomyces]|uniref:Uncharacterized protein n=2 Tax=Streptomyces TaxID=1883 RepID=A0AA89Q018_STRCU|nr:MULTISPECIES: hypothetical protein [Streptomyces]MBB5812042.1 hypothetical protein [Streptomyces collinus]MEC7054883.1 hypothetical protein [Streptomyces violaceochromogenes]WMX65224.1 hypothetical protein RFN52_18385 [Streptomyces collinus]GHC76017.1 hypothetical protein GCM10010309_47840 [Streptomyces violaceochromogenes]
MDACEVSAKDVELEYVSAGGVRERGPLGVCGRSGSSRYGPSAGSRLSGFAAHHYTLVPDALSQGLAKPRSLYMSWGPQLCAAAYPAAVTMMSLVASPAWRSLLAESMFPSDVDHFMKEFTRRLPPNHPAYAANLPSLANKTGAMVRRVTQILRETKTA